MNHASPARPGAVRQPDGTTRFRVWAPAAQQVELLLTDNSSGKNRIIAMQPTSSDDPLLANYYDAGLDAIDAGTRYQFRLNGGEPRADPCSLDQPGGATGPSAVFYPDDFDWTDSAWRGVPRGELAIYELHIGTFTPAGTFEAAIDRLDDLVELGITAIEIMPIAQFPGERNWGYDGVLPYAAQNSYGGPLGLQKLVDAAHARGIAVILDVVYNHIGPEHSYLREFGPYFTDKYRTPWGEAINYDDRGSDAVRAWVLGNVRMWIEEFHLDGLRLDAVHAIYDLGATHILQEIHQTAIDIGRSQNRVVHVIAESDLNDPRIVQSTDRGGYGLDAQWSDDFHHAVHALLTNERRGYYVDYGEAMQIADVLASPFLGAGQYSRHRGRRHGAPPTGLAGDRFIVCIQNHDQVGNRAIGDRLPAMMADRSHPAARVRLAASLLLLAPHVPMLFMGEEYGETRPFPFFCSFEGPELIEAVRQGRRREFADFVSSPDEIPDPASAETYESAKLAWSWPEGSAGAQLRLLYQDLLAARRRWPAMRDFERRSSRLHEGGNVVELTRGEEADGIRAWFNLGEHAVPLPSIGIYERVIFTSESTRYGGDRTSTGATEIGPFECVVAMRKPAGPEVIIV